MKLGKETIEKYCRFDAEFSKKEWDMLRDYGLKTIQMDGGALVNYAVNNILVQTVKKNKNYK